MGARRSFSEAFEDAVAGRRPETKARLAGALLGSVIGRALVAASYAVGALAVADVWGAI